jgi:hypothetical protein
MPCSSHPPRLYHSDYIWLGVLSCEASPFSSVSNYFIPLGSKYSQHPVFKCPQSTSFLSYQTASFTPIQNYRQIYSFVYFNLDVFRQQINVLNRTLTCSQFHQESNFYLLLSLSSI